MQTPDHPALQHLKWKLEQGAIDPAAKTVLKFGKQFVGVARPRGYRWRAQKQCFSNSHELALKGKGTYVEGFASSAVDPNFPVHHAWLTLNGEDAVDVTWRSPPEKCFYFGIAFPNEIVTRYGVDDNCWVPVLRNETVKEIEEVLRQAGD
jgi:hypothetical protein